MKRTFLPLILFEILSISAILGQEAIPELTKKDSVVSQFWLAEVGFNVVDDSEEGLSTLPTISGQWNSLPYPSRFGIGRYFKNGLGVSLIGSINLYKAGNTINSVVITEDIPYRALDARISYDLNKVFGETGPFDPYAGIGFGVSNSSNRTYPTYNGVVGLRLWVSQNWAFDLNSSGKWQGLNRINNHVQHAAGLVYRFGMTTSLSKKGAEKLALRDAMILARGQKQDSIQRIAAQQRQLRLAEEQARTRAIEEAQQEEARIATLKKQDSLRNTLREFGNIQFAFNSSVLAPKYKEVLNKIATFMNSNQELKFEIHAHTDSRGSLAYNQLLSQRRAARVVSYLVSLGIAPERLNAQGFGESALLNRCSDGNRCTEAEHAINRRCTVEIANL